jgi:hypothetical protein
MASPGYDAWNKGNNNTSVPSPTQPQDDNEDANDDNDSVDSDDSSLYSDLIQSIRSDTGLEIAVQVTWPLLDRPLTLTTCLDESDMAPLFHGTQWAGTRVWQAAVVALQYLLSDEFTSISENSDDNANTRKRGSITPSTSILELGAGLAVPSMVLRALTKCQVVVTDVDSLVPQLQANLQANHELLYVTSSAGQHEDAEDGKDDDPAFSESAIATAASNTTTATNPSSSIQACALDWSREGVQELLETHPNLHLDIVLNCDCIFEPLYGTSWKQLVECQEALLQAFPDAFVLTCCERRQFDGIDKYLQAVNDSDVVVQVEQLWPTSFRYPKVVELYRLHGR